MERRQTYLESDTVPQSISSKIKNQECSGSNLEQRIEAKDVPDTVYNS